MSHSEEKDFFVRYAHKIEKSSCCWEWIGGRTGNGYGAARLDGKQIGAHVAAYISAHGPVEDGLCVMHTCDNPLCVRPDHLQLGTTAKNMADRTEKGRAASGEKNGRSKLTEEQVGDIRKMAEKGISKASIARNFGVSDTLIRYIVQRKNWSKGRPSSASEEGMCDQLDQHAITGWVREHRFHPTRKWRFDIAFPEHGLAVEVEGGVYTQGRHTRGKGFTKDAEKYNEAALLGWTVIRVTPEHVRQGQAVAWIKRAMEGAA